MRDARRYWTIGLSLCVFGCGSAAEQAPTTGAEADSQAGSTSLPLAGAGGSKAAGGAGGAGATVSTGTSGAPAASGGAAAPTAVPVSSEKFSFFVTSLDAIRALSGSDDGFGGDLRYGESTGLAGADKICTAIAERSMPGAGAKGWRAFLSAAAGGSDGGPVHARDRIGAGPWYDRVGRLVAMDLTTLLGTRPAADSQIMNDLPNEQGEPNRGSSGLDNHDTVTGSDAQGRYNGGSTCADWTSTQSTGSTSSGGRGGRNGPMCGHSWPAQSGQSWIASHAAPSCAPGVNLVDSGGGGGTGIGGGGGYGGFYCFALEP